MAGSVVHHCPLSVRTLEQLYLCNLQFVAMPFGGSGGGVGLMRNALQVLVAMAIKLDKQRAFFASSL